MLPPTKSQVEICPACRAAMVLDRVLPRFGSLPEAWIFRCLRCGEILSKFECPHAETIGPCTGHGPPPLKFDS